MTLAQRIKYNAMHTYDLQMALISGKCENTRAAHAKLARIARANAEHGIAAEVAEEVYNIDQRENAKIIRETTTWLRKHDPAALQRR